MSVKPQFVLSVMKKKTETESDRFPLIINRGHVCMCVSSFKAFPPPPQKNGGFPFGFPSKNHKQRVPSKKKQTRRKNSLHAMRSIPSLRCRRSCERPVGESDAAPYRASGRNVNPCPPANSARFQLVAWTYLFDIGFWFPLLPPPRNKSLRRINRCALLQRRQRLGLVASPTEGYLAKCLDAKKKNCETYKCLKPYTTWHG